MVFVTTIIIITLNGGGGGGGGGGIVENHGAFLSISQCTLLNPLSQPHDSAESRGDGEVSLWQTNSYIAL